MQYAAKQVVDYVTNEPTWIVMCDGIPTGYKICKNSSGFRVWGSPQRFTGLGAALSFVVELLTK